MRNDSDDVKRRFASLIESVLRSSAQGNGVGAQDQLQALVQRSDRYVFVRLHWRKKAAPSSEPPLSAHERQGHKLISYRFCPQVGEYDVVIMVTRDAESPEPADQHFVH